jgi:hypothetical protein
MTRRNATPEEFDVYHMLLKKGRCMYSNTQYFEIENFEIDLI